MSRAFVKEAEGSEAVTELPDRHVSHHHLVTPRGLALIDEEIVRLKAALAEAQGADDQAAIGRITRDLRYFTARRATAEVVHPTEHDEIRFGSRVSIRRDDGREQTFTIVGEDEADPAKGLLSYVSPLAQALMGKRVGEVVPAGQGQAEITAVGLGV